ncbi:hypothetical protein ACFLU5_18070 [Bacteroidota bacterium]
MTEVYSQDKYLVLEKLGRKKRIVLYPGDEITFKMKNSDLEITDAITDLHDSLVLLTNSYIKPKEIDYVRIEHTKGFLSPSNGPKLIIAGVSLFIIDQFNHSILQGNDFRVDKDILKASFILVIGGAIWKSFRFSKFRNKGNRRIRIVVL